MLAEDIEIVRTYFAHRFAAERGQVELFSNPCLMMP
jgi:hypothetical protein